MADMPTSFWAGWIVVLTLVSFAGLGWLIFSAYFTKETYAETAEEPIWDENLREGSNPAPMWWFWLIFSAMVFSVIYLMLYPGLGSFAGALKWSQGGRLNDSIVAYQVEFGGTRQLVAEARLETIRADDALMRSAQRVFDRNCAVCHGYDAKGQAALFPNLVDDEWQWGGAAAQIEQSIRAGRKAVMVSWQQVLGDEGVEQVTDYVLALRAGTADGHPGQSRYMQFCVACHGPAGAGNVLLGAPSLVDDVALYGNDREAIRYSIVHGRYGEMPAYGERLDETQIRLLVALLLPPSAVPAD